LTRPGTTHRVEHTLRTDPPLCRSEDTDAGETRYYTSTATITFDGTEVYRAGPKGETNVWIRNHETGEIRLRDPEGEIHGRFDTPDAVFNDPDGYLTDGACRVKAPVIPEAYDHAHDDPAAAATIIEVPEGAESMADLSIAGYPTGSAGEAPRGEPAEVLAVPDRAARLYALLCERDIETVTKRAAHQLVTDYGNGLDASRRSVNAWVNALRDAGVLTEVGTDEHGATVLEVQSPDVGSDEHHHPATG